MNPFSATSNEVKSPGFVPGEGTASKAADFSEYVYRIGFFQIGGEEGLDQQAELESLLTRSINPNGGVVIVDRKESISPASGVYTVVVTYMERRVNAPREESQEQSRSSGPQFTL